MGHAQLANLWLIVDIHSMGGKHLLSGAVNGPPTACLYKEARYAGLGQYRDADRERAYWQFEAPVPPGWAKHKKKKVTAYFVDPVIGKALLLLDRQRKVKDVFYDVTQPCEYNGIENSTSYDRCTQWQTVKFDQLSRLT